MSQTVYLTPNPALRRLGKTLFDYTGDKFEAVASERVEVNTLAEGGTWSDYALVRGDIGAVEQLALSGYPWHVTAPFVEIAPDVIVAEHRNFCGRDTGIVLHVHPSRLPALLPAPSGELTRDEAIVLVATRSLKSSYAGVKNYRFSEARRETGITEERWNAARSELMRRGLLNKAGAITVDGRNQAGDMHLYELRHGKE